jgi:HK97 family phage prohead protease
MTTTLERRTKLFSLAPKSIDEENKTVRFCNSDDLIDRNGEKVAQSTWDLENFLKNPIMLWNHKNGWDIEPAHVLGTWSNFETVGVKTFADAKFDHDINPKTDTVFKQIIRGTLRCVSVGFIPHSFEMEGNVPVLEDLELLEVSIVPIPANANAVALAYKEGI